MAREMAEAGIQTTLITDSAVFSMMAHVNKVIVSCHAGRSNGLFMSFRTKRVGQ